LTVYDTLSELIAALEGLITPDREKPRMTLGQLVFSNMLPKMAILVMVIVFWAIITSRQGQIVTVTAPVRMHGLSENLSLVRSAPEEVDVQLKSYSILTPLPSKLDIAADVDLSPVREGQTTIRIKSSDFRLPSGMVLSSVNPPSIKIVTDRKERRRVPVKVVLRGNLGRGTKGFTAVADPSTVEVEGPAAQVSRIEAVATEEIDAGQLLKGRDYSKNLLQPEKNISILRDESVSIRLVPREKLR